jgi:hypothetical protein
MRENFFEGASTSPQKSRPAVSCPHLLRASMNTAINSQALSVVMDCRDEPGNDNMGRQSLRALP